MAVPRKDATLSEELKWVKFKEDVTVAEKVSSKGITGALVLLGCATTAGVLTMGLYYMWKKNSKKQQLLMRYRVLAQGITLCVAASGIYSFRSQEVIDSKPK